MQLTGYEVRQGKHLSFRAPEQKNFTYMKLLGSYCTEEYISTRLEKKRCKTKAPKHLSKETRLYINISTYVTTSNWKGFKRWAKLNNLLNYEDFQQPISNMENSVEVADQRIEEISVELGTQRFIQKHCDSYRLCRKVIEDCKSAKNPKHIGPNIKQNTNCTSH